MDWRKRYPDAGRVEVAIHKTLDYMESITQDFTDDELDEMFMTLSFSLYKGVGVGKK